MLLVVRRALLAAHETRRCRVFPFASLICSCRLLSDARCLLHVLPGFAVFCAVSATCRMLPVACCRVACCPVHAVGCLFHVVRGLLHAARCPLHVALHVVVARCMLLAVWRMLHVARFTLHAVCYGCMSSTAWRMLFVCCTRRVVWCIFPVHVACRLLFVALFQWSSAALLAVGSWLRALSLLHVARSLLHVACFLLPA